MELKDDLETRDYLSQAFIRSNDLPAANEQLQRLAEAEPANVQIWLRMAEVAYMMEDYRSWPRLARRPSNSTTITPR